MVAVKIYPSCLKCNCPKYNVKQLGETFVYFSEPERFKTDNIIKCEHESVCKFIDGQEPIEIGEQCE